MPQKEANKDIAGFTRKEYASEFSVRKNYLLVIGIDDYLHCPKLFNAVKDAQAIVDILVERFQFEPEHIQTLFNQSATKKNIYKAFEYFAEQITPADNFLIYFSGHGEYKKLFNLGYWIPVEAEEGAIDQYIPNSEIRNILSAISAHHTFLMVDSCFSGLLFAKGRGRNISLRKERDPSRWGLTSGRNEIVTDGVAGENSPFARSLLYQFRNTDKPIGVAELCDKVLEVVAANASQTPRGEPLKIEGHQGGQFVFHLKKDELGDWEAAQSEGSVAVFEAFLDKYPDGKYHKQAREALQKVKAAGLWAEIEKSAEDTVDSIRKKLQLVNQYVDHYEDEQHYDSALDLGLLLEYKKDFLRARSSEFALRKFLRRPVPEVKGAGALHKRAEEVLQEGEKEEVPVPSGQKTEKTTPPPPEKAKSRKKTTILPPKEQHTKKENARPSFLEKYRKFLIPLMLLPFMIWGILTIWPGKSKQTILEKEFVLYQDKKTQLWGYKVGGIIKIKARYDKATPFKNGRAKVVENGNTFYINTNGKCIFDCPRKVTPGVLRDKLKKTE